MKKYEMTNESIEFRGVKLFRIRALQDFRGVNAGDLGGYIEKEENLSQYDYCWVYYNAKVFGDARIYGNAMVYGNARVYGNAMVYGNARVYGNAEVYDYTRVYGNAEVYGNARVYGNAEVYGNADAYKDTHVLQIGAIGSRDDTTTFFRTKDKKIYVICGCFGGDIEKFEKAVEKEHKDTKHEKAYKLAIELAKLQIELED